MAATPTWDPHQYLRHAAHRARPFADLLAQVTDLPADPARIADLGCGPGNVTVQLAERWPTAHITGYDNSAEMLAEAQEHAGPTPAAAASTSPTPTSPTGHPPRPTTSSPPTPPSNGCQDTWQRSPAGSTPSHPAAPSPSRCPTTSTRPCTSSCATSCGSARWKTRLTGVLRATDSVHDPLVYLDRLEALGCTTDIWQTTYMQLLNGPDAVLDWAKGTGLRPLLTTLADDPEARDSFLTAYRDLLRDAYPEQSYGTVLPFRRLFVVARKKS